MGLYRQSTNKPYLAAKFSTSSTSDCTGMVTSPVYMCLNATSNTGRQTSSNFRYTLSCHLLEAVSSDNNYKKYKKKENTSHLMSGPAGDTFILVLRKKIIIIMSRVKDKEKS